MLTGYIYKNAHLAQTYSNVSSLEVFNILYTFLMFPLFFQWACIPLFSVHFFTDGSKWLKKYRKDIQWQVQVLSPLPPSLWGDGSLLPVSRIFLQRGSIGLEWELRRRLVHLCVWDLISRWRLSPLLPRPLAHTHHSHRKPHLTLCGWQWVLAAGPLTQKAGDGQAHSSRFWFSFHSPFCSLQGTVGFISFDSRSRKMLKDGSASCPHFWWPPLPCFYL